MELSTFTRIVSNVFKLKTVFCLIPYCAQIADRI